MKLHAHKPGVSQAVSIAEILAAIPSPVEPSGGELPTGAVVLMPTSLYEDYLSATVQSCLTLRLPSSPRF